MFDEEDNTDALSSSKTENVKAFIQDSPDADEDVQCQISNHQVDKNEANGRDVKAEVLENDLFDRENEDQSKVKHETERKVLENSVQDGEILQTDVGEEHEKKLMKNEENKRSENTEPLQVWPGLQDTDEVVSLHGPGPLVTGLEDEEQLETIHLPVNRPLRIDELPDLEDLDEGDFTRISSLQIFKPKIEVLPGDSDEETPAGNQSEGISSSDHQEKSLFLISGCNKSTGLSHTSSLVEDEDSHHPEMKTKRPSSVKRCLIEELD